MTEEEAKKIASVIAWADDGCATCIKQLCKALNGESLGWVFAYDAKLPWHKNVTVSEAPKS